MGEMFCYMYRESSDKDLFQSCDIRSKNKEKKLCTSF